MADSVNNSRWKHYGGTPWEAVDAAIDMLLEVAKYIRKSTVSKHDTRVPSRYSRPDDGYFEDMAKLLVRVQFRSCRRTLADQLGTSIFTRRKRLLYQHDHEIKLSQPRSGPLSGGNSTSKQGNQGPQKITHTQNMASPVNNQAGITPSITDLSTIDRTIFDKPRSHTPSILSGQTRGRSHHESDHVEYPKAPSVNDGRKEHICPYCSEPLPRAKLGDVAFWKYVRG